jgi:hypothetical protein
MIRHPRRLATGGGPGGDPGCGYAAALAGYEREQRIASQRVQNDNARIFAAMALRSTPLAAARGFALLGLSHVPR